MSNTANVVASRRTCPTALPGPLNGTSKATRTWLRTVCGGVNSTLPGGATGNVATLDAEFGFTGIGDDFLCNKGLPGKGVSPREAFTAADRTGPLPPSPVFVS